MSNVAVKVSAGAIPRDGVAEENSRPHKLPSPAVPPSALVRAIATEFITHELR